MRATFWSPLPDGCLTRLWEKKRILEVCDSDRGEPEIRTGEPEIRTGEGPKTVPFDRVGGERAALARAPRGRVWEPSQGSHLEEVANREFEDDRLLAGEGPE